MPTELSQLLSQKEEHLLRASMTTESKALREHDSVSSELAPILARLVRDEAGTTTAVAYSITYLPKRLNIFVAANDQTDLHHIREYLHHLWRLVYELADFLHGDSVQSCHARRVEGSAGQEIRAMVVTRYIVEYRWRQFIYELKKARERLDKAAENMEGGVGQGTDATVPILQCLDTNPSAPDREGMVDVTVNHAIRSIKTRIEELLTDLEEPFDVDAVASAPDHEKMSKIYKMFHQLNFVYRKRDKGKDDKKAREDQRLLIRSLRHASRFVSTIFRFLGIVSFQRYFQIVRDQPNVVIFSTAYEPARRLSQECDPTRYISAPSANPGYIKAWVKNLQTRPSYRDHFSNVDRKDEQRIEKDLYKITRSVMKNRPPIHPEVTLILGLMRSGELRSTRNAIGLSHQPCRSCHAILSRIWDSHSQRRACRQFGDLIDWEKWAPHGQFYKCRLKQEDLLTVLLQKIHVEGCEIIRILEDQLFNLLLQRLH
ncbi:MAG: hypothetical protein M1822_007367 [Bathelium mastoideum]|nr:MAG: hypothetical protein M1822_007367 [Bathelium mastoideum]